MLVNATVSERKFSSIVLLIFKITSLYSFANITRNLVELMFVEKEIMQNMQKISDLTFKAKCTYNCYNWSRLAERVWRLTAWLRSK